MFKQVAVCTYFFFFFVFLQKTCETIKLMYHTFTSISIHNFIQNLYATSFILAYCRFSACANFTRHFNAAITVSCRILQFSMCSRKITHFPMFTFTAGPQYIHASLSLTTYSHSSADCVRRSVLLELLYAHSVRSAHSLRMKTCAFARYWISVVTILQYTFHCFIFFTRFFIHHNVMDNRDWILSDHRVDMYTVNIIIIYSNIASIYVHV